MPEGLQGHSITRMEVLATTCVCLNTPQYTLRYSPGSQSYSEIHGTEYEVPVAGTHEHNVPCAMCFASTRVAVSMIPARTSCPTGWTRSTMDT